MNTNFAQRAKQIVAKHGKDKKAAMQELDALRREQFAHEQQLQNPNAMAYGGDVTMDREMKDGITVEKEHKSTLDFIKKYYKEKGKFPSLNKFAKSIATDHLEDFKINPNRQDESYYKGLIESGLSDEKSEYAYGGNIHPLNISDAQLEQIRSYEPGGQMSILDGLALQGGIGGSSFPIGGDLSRGNVISGGPGVSFNSTPEQDARLDSLSANMQRVINPVRQQAFEQYPEFKSFAQRTDLNPYFNNSNLNHTVDSLRTTGMQLPEIKTTPESKSAIQNYVNMGIGLGVNPDVLGTKEYGKGYNYDGPRSLLYKPMIKDVPGASHYGFEEGGELNQFGSGGDIHIKKSHEGRFTEYKKRTGNTTAEALKSSDPHVRQMANFARNAAKWKHEDGGELGREQTVGNRFQVGGLIAPGTFGNQGSVIYANGGIKYDGLNTNSGQLDMLNPGRNIGYHTTMTGFGPMRTDLLPNQNKQVDINQETIPNISVPAITPTNMPYDTTNGFRMQGTDTGNNRKYYNLIQKYFGDEAGNAYKIMNAESEGNPYAIGHNKDGFDRGLFQINDKYHPWNMLKYGPDPYDPEANIKYASDIYHQAEASRGKGNGWKEWSTYSKVFGSPSSTPNVTETQKQADQKLPTINTMTGLPMGASTSTGNTVADSTSKIGTRWDANAKPFNNTEGLRNSTFARDVMANFNPNENKTDINSLLQYAPIAFNALSGAFARKGRPLPANVSLPTMNAAQISPQQLSVSPTQEAVNSQYRGNVNALSGMTGGSAAAMRSGLTGLALSGAKGSSEALNDIYTKNAMLKGEADKFNASSVDAANRTNLGQKTHAAELSRENQIFNQQDLAARDQARMQSLAASMSGLGQLSKQERNGKLIAAFYGYDPKTGKKIVPGQEAAKFNSNLFTPAEMAKAKRQNARKDKKPSPTTTSGGFGYYGQD
jgi:hypothetical protein